MLRAAPPGHPLQKPTVVQWDIGAMLSADGAADESVSPQSGISRRAHERPVEDYASVMLRSASGILGTIEVGNGFPRDGTDGEWKIAGRDAILTMKDGSMKLATADGDEILPSVTVTSPYFTAVRDALDRWQRGEEPRVSVHD